MKWVNIDDVKPGLCKNIIFTDGDNIYSGWLESANPLEDLMFYDALNQEWPENVTHWCELCMIKLPT